MKVSDEIAEELRKLNNAIETTKKEAKKRYSSLDDDHHFTKYGADEYTLASGHSVSNCGEIWSAREAILNGAKFEDLSLSTYWNAKVSRSLGEFMEKCENCQFTFGGGV